MVSQALVKPNGAGVPDVQRGFYAIEGMEDLKQEDFILPRKSIMQPTQKREESEEHVGHFWDNLSEATTPMVEAVILNIGHSGAKWTGNDEDKGPECRSHDGKYGNKYGACAQCRYNPEANQALWNLSSEEARAQRCNRGYELLCWDVPAEEMFIFGIGGSSVRPFRLFFTKLGRDLKGRGAIFSKVLRFGTQRIVEANKKYYVFSPSILRDATPDEFKLFKETRDAMAGVRIADIDEGEASPAGESDNGAPPAYEEDAPEPEVPPEAYASGGNKKSLF